MNLRPAVEEKVDRRAYAPRLTTKYRENGDGTVTVDSADPISLDDALQLAGFDPMHWEIKEVKTGGHQVPMKLERESPDDGRKFHWPIQTWCNKWHVLLKPLHPSVSALEDVLARMQKASPKVPRRKYSKKGRKQKRALEIDLFDAHIGLSMLNWSIKDAQDMLYDMVTKILKQAEPYGPFDEIVWPFGNDWGHIDNLEGTTSAGTNQPEAAAWHDIYVSCEETAINIVRMLAEVAPVRVFAVPGNHDRMTSFSLGRVLKAMFHGDKNVTVVADKDPYKFWRYGTNLLMFEHGHSIQPIRFASLFAKERPQDYADTTYHEVHCGDKHRKGTAGRIAFEEFGVGVEFCAGLTPTNEWHKLKSFVDQNVMGTAYVWNYRTGPEARLLVRV